MKKEFETHRLSEAGMTKAGGIGGQFEALLYSLEALAEGGDQRCMAIMRTKLEEACFFAKKAMACNPANQESK